MASSDEDVEQPSFQLPQLGTFSVSQSSIKPKLDSIFAEVQDNLPSIDFEISDVSSDEEFSIFQRSLNAPSITFEDDEKDLDESLTEENWNDLLDDNDQADVGIQNVPPGGRRSYTSSFSGRRDLPKPIMHSWVKMDEDVSADDESSPLVPSPRIRHNGLTTDNEIARTNVNEQSKGSTAKTVDTGCGPDTPMNGYEDDNDEIRPVLTNVTNGMNEREAMDENRNQTKDKNSTTKNGRKRDVSLTTNEVVFEGFMPQETTLSMASLENINFDQLCNIVGNSESSAYNEILPPNNRDDVSIYEAAGEIPKTDEEDGKSLIEKLAVLTMGTTGKDMTNIDPLTGAIPKKVTRPPPSQNNEQKNKPKKKTSVSTGCSTVHLPPIVENLMGSIGEKPDRETIFLDLRDTDKNKEDERISTESVRRILNLKQEVDSNSSDSESEDEGLWFEKRRRIRKAIETHGHVTAEDLQDKPKVKKPVLHEAVSKAQRLPRKKPPPLSDDVVKAANRGITDIQGTKTPPNTPTEVTPQAEIDERLEREKQRRLDTARKLKEQRDILRQSRIRLSQRLEALRPKTTVKGRQPCAEATPSLLDLEASYEPAPSPLPPNMAIDQECCLLTVHLSSSGQVMMHRQSSGKSLDSGMGFPGSYPTLLSWLLAAHVPNNFSFLHEPSNQRANLLPQMSYMAPFYVVGLQQIWIDEQLMLIVAVVPTENFDAKAAQGKLKKTKSRDALSNSPFRQMLNKFLSTNTLNSVCPWFSCFEPIKVTSNAVQAPSRSKADESFTYFAPLPSITTKPLSTFIQINPDKHAVSKVFGTSIGFFWQTVDSEENLHDSCLSDEHIDYDTQNTMSLVYRKIYQDPGAIMGILTRVLQEGLDIAGIRLLYPTQALINSMNNSSSQMSNNTEIWNNIGPILALAVRGSHARNVWLDTVGPADPALARRTDPNSLSALFGGESKDNCLFYCPRTLMRTNSEISRWFGGRVPPSGVVEVGVAAPAKKERRRSGSPGAKKNKKVSFSDTSDQDPIVRTGCPPATLTAMSCSSVFLTASPLLPVKALGIVLTMCQRRGYQLRGVRRQRLTSKKATMLGIAGHALSVFCPNSRHTPPTSPVSFEEDLPNFGERQQPIKAGDLPAPSTVFLLQKENALHNTTSLVEAIMIQLCYKGILGQIQERTEHPITSSIIFQATPFSEAALHVLGGEFSKVPDCDMGPTPGYISPQLHTNPEAEQIVTLALTGHVLMKTFGLFLAKLLCLLPHGKTQPITMANEGFELLGLKWLPCLNTAQAKELTPYEVGDRMWKASIHTLTSEPAMVLLLRGVNAFARIQSIIATKQLIDTNQMAKLEKLMSLTPELAYRLATLFFFDRELFSDPESRPLLPYLPPSCPVIIQEDAISDSPSSKTRRSRNTKSSRLDSHETVFMEESIFNSMISGPHLLNTVLVVKPYAVRKHLARVLKRVTTDGYAVVGMDLRILSVKEAEHIVPKDCRQNEETKKKHIDYLISSPCLVMCIQRENAVKRLLDLIGPEDPVVARKQSQLLWRSLYGTDSICNGVYASGNYLAAVADRNLFIPGGLCCPETPDLRAEKVKCPAVDHILDVKKSNNKEVFLKADVVSDSVLSALTQTNCILLSPSLLKPIGRTKKHGYVEVMECLLSHHFEVVGARMLELTEEQAEHYLHLCNAGSYTLVPTLISGPSIVLALQRDNAVMAFEPLLGGSFQTDSVYSKYGGQILRPNSVKQANRHLAFFFDELAPHAQAQISQKSQ